MDKSNLSEADVLTLVRMVQDRPSIWDKTCNKDSNEKRKAWREIYEEFSGVAFDELTGDDQKKLEQDLIAKWTNLRDTFIKQVKKGRAQHYKHYEAMKFLLKNTDLEATPSTSPKESSQQIREKYTLNHRSPFRQFKRSTPSLAIALNKKRKHLSFASKTAKRSYSSLTPVRVQRQRSASSDSSHSLVAPESLIASNNSSVSLVKVESHSASNYSPSSPRADESQRAVQVPCSPEPNDNSINSSVRASPVPPPIKRNIPDEDLAFFRSIVPYLEKMSSDEKLEFQIGVLETIRRIKSS